jgi:hypothetical protein
VYFPTSKYTYSIQLKLLSVERMQGIWKENDRKTEMVVNWQYAALIHKLQIEHKQQLII